MIIDNWKLIIAFLLALPVPAHAFPAFRAGVALDDLQSTLLAGGSTGLLFHPWLTLRTFRVLEQEKGIDVPDRYRAMAALGSIEEDLDMGRCAMEPMYSELAPSQAPPDEEKLVTAAVANARDYIEEYLGFELTDIRYHLGDWKVYARIGLLFTVEWQRTELMRYTLKDYPYHRAENHFLSRPLNPRRGLVEAGEWIMAERNVSSAQWMHHPDNLCGVPALREAVAAEDWDTAFRMLGHVLHLVQDLGVPAHVRNDTHAPIPHPWRFLSSLFDELGRDMRGDRSLDWYDPLERCLSEPGDAFARYDKLAASCRPGFRRAEARASLEEAIATLRGFTARNYYSRDTIFRDDIAGVLLDLVPLKGRGLFKSGDSWCLRNRLGDDVACATAQDVEDAGFEASERSYLQAAPADARLGRLVRRGKLEITTPCVRQCLCRTIPVLKQVSAAWLARELSAWNWR